MARKGSAFLVALLLAGSSPQPLRAAPVAFDPAIERDFVDGMTHYQTLDYRAAEAAFRRILDRDPSLLRVRLELARTLFMQKKDAEADYHFGLAAAKHPAPQVLHDIL